MYKYSNYTVLHTWEISCSQKSFPPLEFLSQKPPAHENLPQSYSQNQKQLKKLTLCRMWRHSATMRAT